MKFSNWLEARENRSPEALLKGLDILRGRDSVRVTRDQVAYLKQLAGLPFQHPDYTIHVDGSGGKDGWKLVRYPNGAGILSLIRAKDVEERTQKRGMEQELETLAKQQSSELMKLITSGDIEGARLLSDKYRDEVTEIKKKYGYNNDAGNTRINP